MRVLYHTQAKQLFLDMALRLREDCAWEPAAWIAWRDFHPAVTEVFPECRCLAIDDVTRSKFDDGPVPGVSSGCLSPERIHLYGALLERVTSVAPMSYLGRTGLLVRQMAYWRWFLETADIDLVFFSDTPHLPHSVPLLWAAEDLGVTVRMFNLSTVPARGMLSVYTYLSNDVLDTDIQYPSADGVPSDHLRAWVQRVRTAGTLPAHTQRHLDRDRAGILGRLRRYLSDRRSQRVKHALFFLGTEYGFFPNGPRARTFLWPDRSYWNDHYTWRDWKRYLSFSRRKKIRLRSEYDRVSRSDWADAPFIYFPLHYQPEMTSVPRGGQWFDQIAVIAAIAAALPDGWRVVVKEHPSTFVRHLFGEQGRYDGYYETLASIRSVAVAPLGEPASAILSHCRGVATVAGSTGVEAVLRGKPAIVFGHPWYRSMPGVVRVTQAADLPEAVAAVCAGRVDTPSQHEIEGFLAVFESNALAWNPGFVHAALPDGYRPEDATAELVDHVVTHHAQLQKRESNRVVR